MAGWVTHMRIADEVLKQLPELDRLGFCLGSIAPDCNVENEDWTAFTPPREVTHWMNGENKLSADYEGFYCRYLAKKDGLSTQERSFYWGYIAHLMTDIAFFRFIHNEQLTEERWERICKIPGLMEKVHGQSCSWENIKRIFGRKRVFAGLIALENEYLYAHPETAYLTVLQTVKDFPDYLDYLPRGAILRKIGVMGTVPEKPTGEIEQIFFTRTEMDGYISRTCEEIIRYIKSK